MPKAVGIDHGTFKLCAYYVDISGKSHTLNQILFQVKGANRRTVPSCVTYLESGVKIVGEYVPDTPPQCMVMSPKRFLGCNQVEASLFAEGEHLQFTTTEDGELAIHLGDRWGVRAISQIVADLLEYVRKRCSEFLGEDVIEATISCPSYYHTGRQALLQKAAKLAGFEKVSLIKEPVAGALAYTWSARKTGKSLKDRMKIGVYDLGAGTFDATVLEISQGQGCVDAYEVLADGGATRIGGDQITREIVEKMRSQVVDAHEFDPGRSPKAWQVMWDAAESLKRQISENSQGKVFLSELAWNDEGLPVDLDFSMAVNELQEIILPLTQATLAGNELYVIEIAIASRIEELIGHKIRVAQSTRNILKSLAKKVLDDLSAGKSVKLNLADKFPNLEIPADSTWEISPKSFSKIKQEQESQERGGLKADMNRAAGCFQELLEKLQIRPQDISLLLFVGGSTRLNLVRREVETFFPGVETFLPEYPEEMVAQGASLFQATRLKLMDLSLIDKVPLSLGIRLHFGHTLIFIPAGTRFPQDGRPLEETKTLVSAEKGVENIEFDVVQGEAKMAECNVKLGKVVIKNPRPEGNPDVVVKFVHQPGLLEVTAQIDKIVRSFTISPEKCAGSWAGTADDWKLQLLGKLREECYNLAREAKALRDDLRFAHIYDRPFMQKLSELLFLTNKLQLLARHDTTRNSGIIQKALDDTLAIMREIVRMDRANPGMMDLRKLFGKK